MGYEEMTKELYKQIHQLRDENIHLLETVMELNRALKKAKNVLDEIEEKYRNNGWFERLKARKY
jgi:predicted RNase H-like nuclease (RuvC/YqgF family)